jgi:rhodanese-related sulfurtransferase
MKKFLSIALATLLITLLLFGCSSKQAQQTPTETATYTQISTAQAVELMQTEKDYIILDVRTVEEYNAGHIPNAICIPNESITDKEPPELPDKDQLILVYCHSGRRSKEASQKLADLGYTKITEFGGIIDWTGETVTKE